MTVRIHDLDSDLTPSGSFVAVPSETGSQNAFWMAIRDSSRPKIIDATQHIQPTIHFHRRVTQRHQVNSHASQNGAVMRPQPNWSKTHRSLRRCSDPNAARPDQLVSHRLETFLSLIRRYLRTLTGGAKSGNPQNGRQSNRLLGWSRHSTLPTDLAQGGVCC